MSPRMELSVYAALIVVLSGLLLNEGVHAAALEQRVALAPKELYKKLAKSQVKLQIVDARSLEDYEEMHVPGAIPLPDCSLEAAPDAARARIIPSVPTIVVSEEGGAALFTKCGALFTSARNLAGGMTAWDDESLPEDSGEYSPPKAGAGGGCL